MGILGSVVGQPKRYFWVAGVGGGGELFLTPQKSYPVSNRTRPATGENKQSLTKYICVYALADTCILFIKWLKIVKKIIFINVRYHSET